MFRPSIFRSVVLLGILASTATGQNQEKPRLGNVRQGGFTGRDREATQAWVEQEINNLFDAPDAVETIRLGAQLFFAEDGLVTHYQADNASRDFQQGLAEIVATAFRSAFQAAPSDPTERNALAATYTLMALRDFNEPRVALECFTLALNDPLPGVRLAALDGLMAIWEPLATAQKQTILGQLQTLAARETDGNTLSRMYAVLTRQPNQVRLAQTAETILKIMETRLADYERTGRTPLLADTEALRWLSDNIGQFRNEPLYDTIVLTAARLLANATESYVYEAHGPQREQKLEITIHQADEVLKTIAMAADNAPRPTPDIARALRAPAEDRKDRVRDELVSWIGHAGRRGYLNMAPFNLSAGLAEERVARSDDEGE